MEVKGTAVKSIPQFVKDNFPIRYNEWLQKLPPKSQSILIKRISSSKWFNLNDSLIIPTQLIGEMFYNDIEKGAFELGIYSSKMALRGIYKMLIKVSSPSFIVARAPSIMSNYYRPSIMEVTEKGDNWAVISILDFSEANIVVDYRILGWLKNTMEFSSFIMPKVTLRKSMGKGDISSEYFIEWI